VWILGLINEFDLFPSSSSVEIASEELRDLKFYQLAMSRIKICVLLGVGVQSLSMELHDCLPVWKLILLPTTIKD